MAIYNALTGTTVHPTADWVYGQLKGKYPDLSLGTVYRNLKQFCASGEAISVGVINGQEHFDGNISPHAHFLCESCGEILDIHEDFFSPEDFQRLSQQYHHSVTGASILLQGTCGSCMEKNLPVS